MKPSQIIKKLMRSVRNDMKQHFSAIMIKSHQMPDFKCRGNVFVSHISSAIQVFFQVPSYIKNCVVSSAIQVLFQAPLNSKDLQ